MTHSAAVGTSGGWGASVVWASGGDAEAFGEGASELELEDEELAKCACASWARSLRTSASEVSRRVARSRYLRICCSLLRAPFQRKITHPFGGGRFYYRVSSEGRRHGGTYHRG